MLSVSKVTPTDTWQSKVLHACSCGLLSAQFFAGIEAYFAGVAPLWSLGIWIGIAPIIACLVEGLRWSFRKSLGLSSFCMELGSFLIVLALYLSLLRAGLVSVIEQINGLSVLPHLVVCLSVGLGIFCSFCFIFLLRGSKKYLVHRPIKSFYLGLAIIIFSFELMTSCLALIKDPPLILISLCTGSLVLNALLRSKRPLSDLSNRLILISSLAIAGVSFAQLSIGTQQRDALEKTRGLSSVFFDLSRLLSDHDHDGFGSWLGGGDCDDLDPTRHPAAYDVPDNGIDEDCDGVDEHLPTTSHTSTTKALTATSAPIPTQSPLSQATKPFNLLILTIDALRADHVTWAHYSRNTTPNLQQLTQSGLIFTHAYTPCSDTRYSIPPLLSGQLLPDLPLDWRGRYLILDPPHEGKLNPDRHSLFERLQEQGYQTIAITGELMTDGMWYGLERGLDQMVGNPSITLRKRSADQLTQEARTQLQSFASLKEPKPWALWLHYTDPHEPYLTHESHDFGRQSLDRYDAEIAYTDQAIAGVIAELKRLRLYEQTIIVLSADHGEEFLEHGRLFHGKQLYDESIRVPLVISLPNAPRILIDEPRSTLDMVETVAELMGLPASSQRLQRSHAARLYGGAPPLNPLPVITYRVHNQLPQLLGLSLVMGSYKLIYELKGKKTQLFHLGQDPVEQQDLKDQKPKVYQSLFQQAQAEVKRFKRNIFESLYKRQVKILQQEPTLSRPLGTSLSLVEYSAQTIKIGTRSLQSVRAKIYVHAASKERLTFKVQWLTASGRISKTLTIHPLGGLYPTVSWRKGELITLESIERIPLDEAVSAVLIIEGLAQGILKIPIQR